MGHLAKDYTEKKSKDSSGGSGEGLTLMCVEGCESPVEEGLEQPNSEVNLEDGLEEKNLEVHPKAQPEQSLLLQDWINSEIQLPTTENQSCTNEV